MRKIAFDPIVDESSRVLLLGTMPSEESLRKQEYYGHRNNQFWKILFSLYNEPLTSDYRERVALLHRNGIALWDVLQSCEGEGSADSGIRNEEANDFSDLFKKYPRIKYIFFTSKKAESFYKKYVGFDQRFQFSVLPSPSPAYASVSFERKLHCWRNILSVALQFP